jgi:signal transduction histidine kinase
LCGAKPTGGDHLSAISAITALPRALHDLGVAFIAVREVAEAIETYTRGIAACDAHPEVYRLVPDDVLLLLTGWAGALQQRHENDLMGHISEAATADLSTAAGILTGRARTLIDNAEKAAAEGATPLSGYGYQSYFSALGRQYLLTGDPVAAVEQFECQMAQGIAVDNAVVCASGEIGVASAFLAQDNFAAALPHALNAIARLSENDEAGIRAEAFLILSRIHSGLGDSQRALCALKSYNLVRDMLQAKDAKLYASYLASRIGLARVRAEADAQRRIADDLAFLNTKLEEQKAALSLQSQELDTARRAAEAANNAKSAFLANMSHELRTPLNAILGFSELMQRREVDATVAGYAQDIHQAGSHLLAIINDVLDLSRIDAGKVQLEIEAVVVADLFADCRKFIAEKAAAAGLKIMTSIADGARTIRGDELRLRQILLNLLSNAVKFTPPGGILTIDASMPSPSTAVISVSDTGCGMSGPEIAVALQPFGMVDGSLSRVKQGTGLGLPLAVRLTALHGGELTIESEPGRGTCASVCLPQA